MRVKSAEIVVHINPQGIAGWIVSMMIIGRGTGQQQEKERQ